ncbi:ABC transporter substrate-binding protein [Aquipseudomonas ullengensis]|uniref:ABC transporter substrate-binding protein n=1 Tax=Aquipseudomonas ullengensis TaxID=2759166 RepID=A0A7W4LQ24_9GAMM|nr:ABC transporter substrate-binding protein [Pseudomonas ullengensis]MBB2497217.1 ABC transporter substrate-binding protein [Pseudomonas ullengensis]
MNTLLRASLLFFLFLVSLSAQATSVVFLNPGFPHERFWVDYSAYMQDAAGDLGMQLQVVYGDRDPHKILQNARDVLQAPQKPDFLVFANEQYVGPEILRLFADSGIKLFALHSTLTPEQQTLAGGSREKYANWIGSLVPNDEEAGYLMAHTLFSLAPQGRGEVVAFSGVKQTPSASLREEGLRRALADHPQIRLRQMVYGEWKEQRAYEQAKALLPRYPEVSLVWSANDEMAFGVMRAAQEQGRTLRYSALNTSPRVLDARIDGRVSALVGGHFILGGCAMVMLHDYAAGLDFAARGGKDQVAPLFRLLDEREAKQLSQHIGDGGKSLNFRSFSAVTRPRMQRYSCSVDSLLR